MNAEHKVQAILDEVAPGTRRGQMISPCSVRDRLDGWKEIACYLRRSVRSVQRWEKSGGLPVVRHRHVRGATVYAFRDELDAWWRHEQRIEELPRLSSVQWKETITETPGHCK